ncbi:MAG: hypothetical protein WC843_05445 [Candidatus Gracilibacteria bacterium]|jgi:hypothetical protein
MLHEGAERRDDDVKDGERRGDDSIEGLVARLIEKATLRKTDDPGALRAKIGEKLQAAGVNVVDELFTEPGDMPEGDSQNDSQEPIPDEEWADGDHSGLSVSQTQLLASGQKNPGRSVADLRAIINESR